MKIASNLSALLLLASIIGCQDARPAYVQPIRVPEKTATLTGAHGSYITEVDGQRVPSATIMFADFGSNTVQVTPGIHQLIVVNSLTTGSTTTYISHYFPLTCAPGHTYQLAPESEYRFNVLCIADKTPTPSPSPQLNVER
jgi:hypothetical protein